MFPQEVIIRLETRTLLQHVMILSKENRSIPECEVYVGDGLTGSFYDADYRHAGTIKDVGFTKPKQFTVFGIGNFLKLVFTKQPKREGKNMSGQVALGIFKVFG